MNRAEFEAVVDDVLAELPEWVVDQIDNLRVVVEEHPSRAQIEQHGNLLGLYEGVMLADRGDHYFGAMPDKITIFRQPHLALRLSPARLRRQIRRTVLHEIGHHLGIDDDRLHEIGWG
ncbi:MAG: metallopeptidase family protein [Acidimicrobiia bacterium]|nr:metallopeptidase family protein [Acidimicrobiia bacterium]